MINERRYKVKLILRNTVAESTYELTFESDSEIEFTPGQYAWVELPYLLHPDKRGSRRAFSITSISKDKKKIAIVFRARALMSGYKQSLIEIPLNSEIIIEAPFGSNTLPEDKTIPIALVAGGVGIAPFMSMLRDMNDGSVWRPTTLIYINRSEKDSAFLDELRGYAKSSPLKLYEVYGHFSVEHFRNADMPVNTHWYLCGPEEMVNSVSDILISNSKEKPTIIYDEFFPSNREKLVPNADLYKMGFDMASNHIVFTDANGVIVGANKSAEDATGYSLEEMIGSTPRLWGGLMSREFYKTLWNTIREKKKSFVGKMVNRRADGSIYSVIAHISPIMDKNKDLIGFIGTEEDITKLEEVDKIKTEFIYLVSHQLRTLLSTISWYTEMLLSGDVGQLSPEQRKYLSEVYDGNGRIIEFVNALLDISRMELGKFIIEPKQTDVTALVRDIVEKERPLIEQKSIKLITSFRDDIPQMQIDPRLLRMVVDNLLSNSMKYTSGNGGIDVSTYLDKDNNVIIKVSDTGCGIPKSQQDKVFTKLFRADNAKEKEIQGTGLGLYIVKYIIDNSGGKVWFESEENKGTTFYVSFPVGGMKNEEK